MAASFPRTLRALERDAFRGSAWAIAAGVVLLGAWTVWFTLSAVSVLEVSSGARLEVLSEARPIESEVAGRVVSAKLELGVHVRTGDVLVELDATPLKLELAEHQARIQSLAPQLAAVAPELDSEQHALASGGGAGRAAAEAARQRLAEAEATLALAKDDLARVEKLEASKAIAGVELVRARTQVDRLSASREAAKIEVDRLGLDERTSTSERQVRIDRLRRDQAKLSGDIEVERAEVARLDAEIARRVLRAPATGKLGAAAPLVPGVMVRDGEIVGSVVPDSTLRIVAEFSPSTALGRIRVGQPAWMRLDGFAWTQYGALPARVSAVAAETQQGKVRVELDVLPDAPAGIPQQHGLPGSVEVEVERVSPATLLLRSLGQYLDRHPAGT